MRVPAILEWHALACACVRMCAQCAHAKTRGSGCCRCSTRPLGSTMHNMLGTCYFLQRSCTAAGLAAAITQPPTSTRWALPKTAQSSCKAEARRRLATPALELARPQQQQTQAQRQMQALLQLLTQTAAAWQMPAAGCVLRQRREQCLQRCLCWTRLLLWRTAGAVAQQQTMCQRGNMLGRAAAANIRCAAAVGIAF